MTICEKLMNIQSRLKALKGQYNEFGKYHYRSCEDILEAVKPLLLDNKVVLTLKDNVEVIGNRYYIKTTATVIDVESLENISVSAFAREEESKKGMDSSQVTGASSSYARKYALNGLFAIDDAKDSDTTNNGPEKSKSKAKSAAAPKPTARDKIIVILKQKGVNIAEYSKEKGLNKDTPTEVFEKLLAELEAEKE